MNSSLNVNLNRIVLPGAVMVHFQHAPLGLKKEGGKRKTQIWSAISFTSLTF